MVVTHASVLQKLRYIINFIPVIQYFEGKGTVIWPEEYKQADIVVPDYAK
jgi:hypothetical protein